MCHYLQQLVLNHGPALCYTGTTVWRIKKKNKKSRQLNSQVIIKELMNNNKF